MAGDCQSFARATETAAGLGIGLGERLEEASHLFLGHADTCAGYREVDPFAGSGVLPIDIQGDSSQFCELTCFTEEVDQARLNLGCVGVDGTC